MTVANTWLLPDGVVDVLPKDAFALEMMRRKLVDVLLSSGYKLVDPPLVEYTESLLGRAQEDLKRQTFKIIDQLNGRLMGVRADITQQVARIDAHVLPTAAITRYGYVGQVLHTLPKALFASRTPVQFGAEVYGHAGLAADMELIALVFDVLAAAGFAKSAEPSALVGLHIDLGNIAIFNALAAQAGLDDAVQNTLFDLYQRRALPELKAYCADLPSDADVGVTGDDFYLLGAASGDIDGLSARLSPAAQQNSELERAILDLKRLRDFIAQRWPQVKVSIDLAELSSYHYHTGVVFSVFGEGALPLAQGGRYAGLTNALGVLRPATGFSCDLLRLLPVFKRTLENDKQDAQGEQKAPRTIAAPALQDIALLELVAKYRKEGDVVVSKLSEQDVACATHQLHIIEGVWQLVELAK